MRRNTTVSKWMLNHHWKRVYRLVIFNCIRPAPRISCCRTQTADRVRCEFGLASTIWCSTCGGNRIYFGAPSRQIPFQCGLYAKKMQGICLQWFLPKKNFTVMQFYSIRKHSQWHCQSPVTLSRKFLVLFWQCDQTLTMLLGMFPNTVKLHISEKKKINK